VDWIGDPVTSAWISVAQTGDEQAQGFVLVDNGTTVTFYQSFFLPEGDYIGSISVMADDTTQVWLNDVMLVDFAPDQPGQTYCSDTPIGCLEGTVGWYIPLPPELLIPGDNQLRFVVWQTGEHAFGLNYLGQVQEIPEPASGGLVLLGTGALALARIRRRGRH
jgi:hypothetical protein